MRLAVYHTHKRGQEVTGLGVRQALWKHRGFLAGWIAGWLASWLAGSTGWLDCQGDWLVAGSKGLYFTRVPENNSDIA